MYQLDVRHEEQEKKASEVREGPSAGLRVEKLNKERGRGTGVGLAVGLAAGLMKWVCVPRLALLVVVLGHLGVAGFAGCCTLRKTSQTGP